MMGVLRCCWCRVPEAFEGLGHIRGHGLVNRTVDIVLLKFNPEEKVAFPVCDRFVFFVEVSNEVDGVLSLGEFDIEIVNNEAACDGFGDVFEKSGGEAGGDVATFCKMGE